MDIPIPQAGFEGRGLFLRTAGWFTGPKILVDGQPLKPEKRVYSPKDNSGAAVEIRLKPRFMDPIPNLLIQGRVVELSRPLSWLEYLWMALPLFLVFAGGALGALLGMGAIYASARVFRGEQGTAAKYLLSGLISAVAAGAFVVLVVLIRSLAG